MPKRGAPYGDGVQDLWQLGGGAQMRRNQRGVRSPVRQKPTPEAACEGDAKLSGAVQAPEPK